MKITFLGAAQTVTGSRHLLETDGKVLLIDCGLFQGPKNIRHLNWEKFPVNPHEIDCLLLTHAHIDHSGYIPALVRQGFKGMIHCTKATHELCKILLTDSAHLQEEDAKFANKHGFSKHSPALPLYTQEDVDMALALFQGYDFKEPFGLSEDTTVEFVQAGHILGAAIIRVQSEGKTVIFSGDLGRQKDPIMYPPTAIQKADYVVMESTYGNRIQDRDCDPATQLAETINKTIGQGGFVLIPTFAVERAQVMIYFIDQLKQKGAIPDIPVYVDSPMATNVSDLFCEFDEQHKLNGQSCHRVLESVTYTRSVDESKALDHLNVPSVIISASGMLEGGRILHHLKYYVGDRRNTLVFTGYQASGTRGDYLLSGGKNVRIHGAEYPVKCQIVELCNLSAHADAEELLGWLKHFRQRPKKIFLVHGEKEAAEDLATTIKTKLGFDAIVPAMGYTEELI